MSSEPEAPARDPDPVVLTPGERLLGGKWGWLDFVIVGPVAASTVWYYVGTPLSTWLILHNRAVQAALLRGAVAAMILSGAEVRTGNVGLWAALLAPLPITWCTDPCYYLAGRRYGRVLIDFLCRTDPRWTRRVARGERIFARLSGWAVFLSPSFWLPGGVFYFLAGETRMPFWRFIILDGLGEMTFIAEIVAIGYFIGKPAETFVNSLSAYSLWIILGTVVLLVVISALGGRRGRVNPKPVL